jgi:hypothetical protein
MEEKARSSRQISAAVSMSPLISSSERLLNCFPLYTGQNVHLFQGQFLVKRNNKLPASLGGRIGPCSKVFPYILLDLVA